MEILEPVLDVTVYLAIILNDSGTFGDKKKRKRIEQLK